MALPEQTLNEMPTSGPLVDKFGRAHSYLRLSVTDRCNFRCVYCMPAEGIDWTKREDLLSYEEITRLIAIFASMGIRRIRLTGGEPMVRKDLVTLIAALNDIDGIDDIAMTTNGHRLVDRAGELVEAGLRRINVSLDSLDPVVFKRITRGGELHKVLAGIEAARAAGLTPIKINCVIVRDENEDQLLPLVEAFAPHADNTQVRFIEYMPFGTSPRRHRPAQALRDRLSAHYTLEPLEAGHGGPATHMRVAETGLVVGFISPMTEHFCQACNRLRLQCNGELRTCLSRDKTPSLRDRQRGGADDAELEQAIRGSVWGKVAGHEAHTDGDFKAFEGAMISVGG